MLDPKEHSASKKNSTLKQTFFEACLHRFQGTPEVLLWTSPQPVLSSSWASSLPLNQRTETSEKLIKAAAHESRGTSHDITCRSQPVKLRATALGQQILWP